MRRPLRTHATQLDRVSLLILSVSLLSCGSMMGMSPRSSSQGKQTTESSAEEKAAPVDGMKLYTAKCQSCHGSYAALTTPAGLKKGNLIAVEAAVIRSSCGYIPELSVDEMNHIVTTLAKLKKTNKASKPARLKPLKPKSEAGSGDGGTT